MRRKLPTMRDVAFSSRGLRKCRRMLGQLDAGHHGVINACAEWDQPFLSASPGVFPGALADLATTRRSCMVGQWRSFPFSMRDLRHEHTLFNTWKSAEFRESDVGFLCRHIQWH